MAGAGAFRAPHRIDGLVVRRGAHIPMDETYAGLRFESRDPDVVVVENFLTPGECDELVAAGRAATLEASPVVYAGRSAPASADTKERNGVGMESSYISLRRCGPKIGPRG